MAAVTARTRSSSLNDVDSVNPEQAIQAIRSLRASRASGNCAVNGSSESYDDCAIDDSQDEDDYLADVRRALLQYRILINRLRIRLGLIHQVVPFHWAPMLSPLIESDIDACVSLERHAFPDPGHGATRGQIEYRIKKYGNICMGLFNTCQSVGHKDWWVRTLPHARFVETGLEDGAKRVMFAHFITTLGEHPVVTDNDMMYPQGPVGRESALGHRASGRTLCLHSFAVCPEVQGRGIGKHALVSYMQLVNESRVTDRVALICQLSHVTFNRLGFKLVGQSSTTIAGAGRYHIVFDLVKLRRLPYPGETLGDSGLFGLD